MINFFRKKQDDDSISAKKNWYEDRYQTVVVQRNFLALLIIFSLAGVMLSTLAVIKVTSSKSIEPFVIEIEEQTGITNVIRPLIREQFAYDEALRQYFLMKYMNARETYNHSSFEYNYNNVVRLLSEKKVYASFRRFLASNDPRNPTKLGTSGQRTIKIKSTSTLKTSREANGFTVQVRFQSEDSGTATNKVRHLVATINFDYSDLELTKEERNINPLGFQITGYSVDAETL